MTEHVDVIIVGAGLSGIGAAGHLRRQCPEKSFLILESRSAVGGTWDLFRYPGVRSDSDMYTLGYSFRPWTDGKAIADGAAIRGYIRDTMVDEGLEPSLRLNHRVISASWSSETALWTVTAARTSEDDTATNGVDAATRDTVTFTCSFLSTCSGYYRYDEGFTPAILGAGSFLGEIVHPQKWPADLDYAGKRVVIVGSGATAVTLVPSMAKTAAHVTMLQRSPTYIAPVPSCDHLADRLRGRLPGKLAYDVVRLKNIAYSMFTYQLSRRRPEVMKRILRNSAEQKLPAGFDIDTHLTPTYDPWDQRLCAIPNGDLYRAISAGKAEIVTDRISRITPSGIDLQSGGALEADVIVTATGLNLLVVGGMTIVVDGEQIDVSKRLAYKGMMLEGVPNFALTIGYTNASWTLKADMVARYVCRLLRRMDRHGFQTVTPVAPASVHTGGASAMIELKAGYILRSAAALPRQGERSPWRLHQNYAQDFGLLRMGRLTQDMRFGHRPAAASARPQHTRDAALALPGTAFVTVNETVLRFRRTGEGPAILLLHGIGQSLEDWTEQHDRLSAHHTVYSLDLPGFALSDRMPGTATLPKLAGILPAFLDAMDITGPVPVVGNSLGGAVAMTLAVGHPERVASLVLANSAGFGKEVTIALRLLAIPPIGAALLRPKLSNSTRTVQSIFYDRDLATEARIRHAFTLAQRSSHAQTTLDLARDLGTFRGVRDGWRSTLIAAVNELRMPVLVVWGDHDHVLPFAHLDAAIAALPTAEKHVFVKTGHMPQIERPDEFARVVEGFLARSVASTRKASTSLAACTE